VERKTERREEKKKSRVKTNLRIGVDIFFVVSFCLYIKSCVLEKKRISKTNNKRETEIIIR
jgi:hypothetical protein